MVAKGSQVDCTGFGRRLKVLKAVTASHIHLFNNQLPLTVSTNVNDSQRHGKGHTDMKCANAR